MNILVIMHIASEGPGRLGDFFSARGDYMQSVRLHDGGVLPKDTAGIDLVISLGGPMNVYEDGLHPFLALEVSFLREAMGAGTPLLGICLGAQLIARAAGARVYPAAVKETGWMEVRLTDEGRRDPLFAGLPAALPVLQWHGDTFDVPDGGVLLAAGKACPHQAFRVGRAWGLQFHLEARRDMIADWFEDEGGAAAILARTDDLADEVEGACDRFCRNLAAVASGGNG